MCKPTFSVMLFWLVLLSQSNSIAQPNLFTFVKLVQVAPVGTQFNASFSRIGYVPGRNAMVVTFDVMLNQPEGDCTTRGYAWREYTTDMEATGNKGLINCYGGAMDAGGFFNGNNFYFAFAEGTPSGDGWQLAEYNAVTWEKLTGFRFDLPSGEGAGDPMIALVNGQIDISSAVIPASSASCSSYPLTCATHHHFFTTDLQPITGAGATRVLTDTQHINMSSLIQTPDGVINFLTSTHFIGGDMIVMRYDSNWNPLPPAPAQNWILLKTGGGGSSQTEGFAFDGKRFYVSYIYMDQVCSDLSNCNMNVRLAAFDSSWNLLEDIAVTNFVLGDKQRPARPSLTLHNGRIYVCYDQEDLQNPPNPWDPQKAALKVFVKVYEIKEPATSVPGTVWDQPLTLSLSQNYSNPFNPSTVISYQLPQTSHVVLTVYDVLGKEVQTLVNECQNAGTHSVTFDANNLPTGAYFYRIQAGTFMETKKLMILR